MLRPPTSTWPRPVSGRARWASGARSPEAPTEPCEGTMGWIPRRRRSQNSVDDDGAATGVAQGQSVGPQQHHGPNDVSREWFADSDRVRDEQVLLESSRVGGIDEGGGQVAETGGDAVDDFAGRHEPLDDLARLRHASPRLIAETHAAPAARDGLDVGYRQVRAGQFDLRLGGKRLAEPVRFGEMPVGSEVGSPGRVTHVDENSRRAGPRVVAAPPPGFASRGARSGVGVNGARLARVFCAGPSTASDARSVRLPN